MQVLIGCDPEVFVKRNGVFQSAHNLIPGSKKEPFKVNRGAVQVDGMALEFNIDPAISCEEFVTSIDTVFAILRQMVPEYQIATVPVADFTEELMASQPAEAVELGCDPDFNAWLNGEENVKPNANLPMRTASGHIHIGWTKNADKDHIDHKADCHAVIKQLDYFLGLGSVLLDDDVRRRSMYGKAGCHRPKNYGVEYRTLSNFWLSSKQLMEWVYNNTMLAMHELFNGNCLYDKGGDIQAIINESKRDEARAIINQFNIPMPVGMK